MRKRAPAEQYRRKGMTLMLTLVVLAALSLRLAEQASSVNVVRISSLAQTFSVQSQWVAEGAATQWLESYQKGSGSVDELLKPATWRVGSINVRVSASSCESKIDVQKTKAQRWLPIWNHYSDGLLLVQAPELVLTETSAAALECLIDPTYISAQPLYQREGKPVLGDYLTVWGRGKVDLNRASRDVLSAVLEDFSDVQISGILRLRREKKLESLTPLQELSLSAQQQRRLIEAGVFAPEHVELLIDINHGKMKALYHVVLGLRPGRILEVRVIQ